MPAKKEKNKKEASSSQEQEVTKTEEKREYFYGKGGRKTSTAQVRVYPQGKGEIIINDKKLEDYFPYFEFQKIVLDPLKLTGFEGKVDISVKVSGGGRRGQAEAIRHGISRALVKMNQELRQVLKPAGFLTRDARMKERKKFGLKRARRAPQWQKR